MGRCGCMLSETWGKLRICGVSSLLKLSQQYSKDKAFLSLTLWLLCETSGPQTISFSLFDTLSQASAWLPRHSHKTRQLVFIIMKSNHCSEWKSHSRSNAAAVFISLLSLLVVIFRAPEMQEDWRQEAVSIKYLEKEHLYLHFIFLNYVLYWQGNKQAGSLPGQCLCCSGTEY